uniref:Poly [ADP-ribose] polymerase n=1 Tax=Timema douglasi TaxID=61478 RepID=A0A7R8Z663_TIMDO|nr:unnamed protein product [Timema douglasi]
MMDELPYRAEYAKSGRASCKSCKSPIDKDTLRLAVMVQSTMHDGMQPHWYHFPCFFGKQRPKSVGDIAHFESLRWEDQQKIKTKIDALGVSGSNNDLPEKKGKKRGAAVKDYSVEYAKSNRAACRGCEEKIAKGDVRISKKDYESAEARRYGGLDRWHHVECFTKLREELEFFDSGDSLNGIKTLLKEDQQKVKQALPKISVKVKKEDEVDGVAPEKKVKTEQSYDEGKLKEQNKIMFKYRDNLKRKLKKRDLVQLLEHNNQEVPSGEETMLDRLADNMTFGALKKCNECKTGQLVFQSGVGYKCSGDFSEYTGCNLTTLDPDKVAFHIPDNLAEEYPFLASYKYVPHKRLIINIAPSTSTSNNDAGSSGPKVARPKPPLKAMEFVLLGKIQKSKEEIKAEIVRMGGKLVTKIHDRLAAVISTPEEVEKMNKRMEEVKKCDVHVVSEDFLDEVKDGGAPVLIVKKSICSWGSDVKKRIPSEDEIDASVLGSKSKSKFVKSVPGGKIKVKVKGGVAVDPDSDLDDVAHVLKQGNDIYNSVLNMTDIQSGKNSFYKIQLLQSDKRAHNGYQYWVFRAWGRIGTTIGGKKVEDFDSKEEAIKNYESLFLDKTGNRWRDRKNFVKKPKKFFPIDIDYEDESSSLKLDSKSTVESKLAKPVQDLVQMLFDINTMKKVMIEFELDMEKMPLGKLSKRQIQQAFAVLSELQNLVQTKGSDTMLLDASNRFYTLIPHDFGIENPPIIKTEDVIKQKVNMVESLLEMEIAYSMLKSSGGEGDENVNPVDAHYLKLNTHIEVLERDSEEFKLLQQYVQNTHAETHASYSLQILEVFKVKRQGEDKRYKPFKKLNNRKLLWHGSRFTNFVGILSQGLRIAPPEAPSTGYMFGKGIYFADMVSKSANYCCTSKQNPIGLMLLCEVALGNMYERDRADYIEKLPAGKHSVKGLGMSQPDPKMAVIRPDGVEVPLGKAVQNKGKNVSLLYNEYIVYDIAQVNVQYLLKMEFEYKF